MKKSKEKDYYFCQRMKSPKALPYYVTDLFDNKNVSNITRLIKEIKKLFNNNNEINNNQIKNNKNDKYNHINRNYIIITIIKFIIISILYTTKCNKYDLLYFQYLSKITLKVKRIGNSSIFGNEKNYNYNFKSLNNLKDVVINGEQQYRIDYIYNLNETENLIELIWDDNITNCQYMFYRCTNITEIDLSNFNTSQVNDMKSMFRGCSKLISLYLSDFNTSQVIDMADMFNGFKALISLDLSSFITSQVTKMNSMFSIRFI